MKTPRLKFPLIHSLLAALSLGSMAQAQLKVGNNPTTINSSAALEVESTNKGFLPPRVQLTGVTDTTTIPNPATGLTVVNINAAGTGSNAVDANTIYYWKGARWSQVADGAFASTVAATARTAYNVAIDPTESAYWYPTFLVSNLSGPIDSDGSFTAPATGFYLVAVSWDYYGTTYTARHGVTPEYGDYSTLGQPNPTTATTLGLSSLPRYLEGDGSSPAHWNSFDITGVRYMQAGEKIGALRFRTAGGNLFDPLAKFRNINIVVTQLGK